MVAADIQPKIDEVKEKLDHIKLANNIQTQKDCIFYLFFNPLLFMYPIILKLSTKKCIICKVFVLVYDKPFTVKVF